MIRPVRPNIHMRTLCDTAHVLKSPITSVSNNIIISQISKRKHLPHSPSDMTVRSLPDIQASTSKVHLFGYVLPSEPHTGLRISGQS